MSKASSLPKDQATRARFIERVDENFSVIAPAGVGKTKAIVDRVVAIATGPNAKEWLPKLVVVTYTKKAADEMHQRARNAIIERKVDLAILSQFNRAFFGTIHSFCVKLLRSHGHLLGLPGAIDAVEDDEELWTAFVRQLDVVAPNFPKVGKTGCVRFQPLEKILKLATKVRRAHMTATLPMLGPCPMPRLDALLNYQAKGAAKTTVERTKESLRSFQRACAIDAPFVPMPDCASKAAGFVELWENAFGPLQEWLTRASWAMAIEIAAEYRAFRLAQGKLTYDDQIDLALDLVRDPRAGAMLRAEEFRVILDEAQDTDPSQFSILLALAEAADGARGIPAPGRFCMVGDPQQSIYGSRADLAHYAGVREKLLGAKAATEINFDVTFRCDRAIIDAVNKLAAPMLNGQDGQAEFYPLQARPNAGPGQVIRLDTPAMDGGDDDERINAIALHEARFVARWIKEQGLAKFGANTWSDVAVLCPRRRWISPMEEALREEGLIPQTHSDDTIRGDSPVYAWFTALCVVMAEPANGFEIVGVLREVFGLSDDALARFSKGDGAKFQIGTTECAEGTKGIPDSSDPDSVSSVHSAVKTLSILLADIIAMPLRDAVHAMVTRTQLRERLRAIGEVGDELDGLLALASIAESRGDSLADFSESLRDNFDAELPGRPVQEDAVQLISCHKAKGLQWEAVIVPFLFRPISTRSDYPAVIQAGDGRPPLVAFSSSDVGDLGETLDLKRRQETQRLLYVALTRAKKTLVLVDDRDLIARKKANDSFADLLGLMDTKGAAIANDFYDQLPTKLCELDRDAKASATRIELGLPELKDDAVAKAKQLSAAGPARVLPYMLAEKQHDLEREERRDEPKSDDAEVARLYGIWWHELMEAMDWKAAKSHDAIAMAHFETCPQRDRGEREWKLLRDAKLMARLVPADAIVHAEMPFLFNRAESEWMEGVMDLAIFYPAENRWLILDWKTNLIAANNVQSLRPLYAPQLGAYAEALRAITGQRVETGIYSTATGVWLPM